MNLRRVPACGSHSPTLLLLSWLAASVFPSPAQATASAGRPAECPESGGRMSAARSTSRSDRGLRLRWLGVGISVFSGRHYKRLGHKPGYSSSKGPAVKVTLELPRRAAVGEPGAGWGSAPAGGAVGGALPLRVRGVSEEEPVEVTLDPTCF
jgi:hypothetical protein